MTAKMRTTIAVIFAIVTELPVTCTIVTQEVSLSTCGST